MNSATINDEEVIAAILGGDPNRYGVLMQKYNQRLYRVCKGYIRDEAEIEDLMQETYIKAYINLSTFAGRSSFSTWITRILINETLQKLRSNGRRDIFENRPGGSGRFNGTAYADPINPEITSMNKELRDLLEKNIEDLPENYRVVFMMREIERMSVAETAESLGITETNVKVRLNRAKEMLRQALMKAYPVEELFEFNLVRCSRIAANVMSRLLAVDQ